MSVNNPLAPDARKIQLSAEDAERFASQIRPSWEFIDPDAPHADGPPEAATPETSGHIVVPALVKPKGPSGTILQGPSLTAIGKPLEPPADEPMKPLPIASIGEPSPAAEPAPTAVLATDVPNPLAPVAPRPPMGKTRVGIGTDGEAPEDDAWDADAPTAAAPMVPTAPEATESAPANVQAIAPEAPPVADVPPNAITPGAPAHEAQATRSARPSAARPTGDGDRAALSSSGHAPMRDETDEIEIPIAGPSKGFAIKLGVGAFVLLGLVLGIRALVSTGDKPAPTPMERPAASLTPSLTAAPPPPPSIEDVEAPSAAATAAPTPPAATGTPAVPPPPTATAAPVAVPTIAPATPPAEATMPPPPRKEPPATATPKPAPSPPAGGTPTPKKGGGGIIRETPF
jgi:hypothetical protein